MSKLKIFGNEWVSYLKRYVKDEIDIVPIDYTRKDINTLIVEIDDPNRTKLVNEGLENNIQVVVSNIFEQERPIPENVPQIQSEWYFWPDACYDAIERNLEDVWARDNRKNLLAFMPMAKERDFRTTTYNKFKPLLDRMYWSYLDKRLPGDSSSYDDRYYNPWWYNDTYTSVVLETSVKLPIDISEKTFKPMIFKHPFLILGAPGILNKLKEVGFVTFDNIFDESYDSYKTFTKRLLCVYDNVSGISKTHYDKETLNRIAHNHNLLFNRNKVNEIIKREIINPIKEYAEAR